MGESANMGDFTYLPKAFLSQVVEEKGRPVFEPAITPSLNATKKGSATETFSNQKLYPLVI